MNNKMSNFLMQIMEKNGIPTHFVEEISDRETVVKRVEISTFGVIIKILRQVVFKAFRR